MYQALYRKYRPQVFDDVVGLPDVTRTLKNEIMGGKIAHAYLFTGSRGTGKTTCARILAKAINCLSPIEGNPCCECEACRRIDSGTALDIAEIDAASNNGVDNIRDLRDSTAFTPAELRARVFIIDEVHMLSTPAFNALLKTLEEPPEYVYFILATTEVQDLPATILSRCQRFDFHRIPNDAICSRIKYIASQENIKITAPAAEMISRVCDGGMRDAVSLLDLCSSYGDVTETVVIKAAGLADKAYLLKFADIVNRRATDEAITLIDELYQKSLDMEQLCREAISTYRDMMLLKVSHNDSGVKADADTIASLKVIAERYTLEEIIAVIDGLQKTREKMSHSSDRLVDMEIAVVKLCEPSLTNSIATLTGRLSRLERIVERGEIKITATPAPAAENIAPSQSTADTKPQPVQKKNADESTTHKPEEHKPQPVIKWAEIIADMRDANPVAAGFLCNASALLEGNQLVISGVIDYVRDEFRKNSSMKECVEKSASKILGMQVIASVVDAPQKKTEKKTGLTVEDILSTAEHLGIPVDG